MPLPLAPVTAVALRYGAVAIAAYAVSRKVRVGRRDQRAEDALDDLDEGIAMRRDGKEVSTAGRYRRVIRLGDTGPAVEIDIAGFGRFRIRKVD